ncbi:alpha/beta hydrolase [Tardiphaga robiniae]|nr:alpha/beta hydrolase [Tardiphaga robiniae]
MVTPELVTIDVRAGAAMESQSGLAMLRPRIWGAFARPAGSKVAAIVIHPTSNFMGHYLIGALAERGVAMLGLNTRYLGNDAVLVLERAIQDLGAGVKWLRQQGFERILLLGNSGGGALVSFYQAQAEALTIEDTPAGDPIDLLPEDLPPADAISLNAAHLGRSRLMDTWLDPALIEESDALGSDPALDMFNPENGPAYSAEFMMRYRAAQKARNARIEIWARQRLRQIRAAHDGPRDMAFIIHRTLADPRCLDPALDPNDRIPGTTVWGPPRAQNYAANSMGRYTSLTGYLSQWSQSSRGDGPANLAHTSVPVLLLEHTADASVFPSDNDTWASAAAGRAERHVLRGGNHYLAGQPHLVQEAADRIAAFSQRL